MENKIIIIGSGGHAISCIEVIESLNKYFIHKIYDTKTNKKKLFDYEIIKNESALSILRNEADCVCIGIGFIKDNTIRKKIIEMTSKLNFKFPNIYSSTAYISKNSENGIGNTYHHNIFINSDTKIGNFNIINSNSILEHGVQIGDNCHISTKVVLNGDVIIGNDTFIGSGTVIKNGVKIGNKKIIPMGSIIKNDV